MRLIDGDVLVMLLTDWWYASFGQTETQESKAIKAVLDQVKIHVEKHECKPCEVGTQMSLPLCEDAISRQATIDALNEYFARIGKLQRGGQREKAIGLDMVGVIKNMPSVTPTKLISKISIEDEILNGIATELAKEIKENLIITDFSGNTRTITATKAALNVPAMPPVYAVSADDVIENMEAELELCNKVLDDVNIVGTAHMIYDRVAEMLQEQIDFVKGLPQVEPEPRKGKWIGKYPVTSICSECNYLISDSKVKVFAYCPNCGAKMEE